MIFAFSIKLEFFQLNSMLSTHYLTVSSLLFILNIAVIIAIISAIGTEQKIANGNSMGTVFVAFLLSLAVPN